MVYIRSLHHVKVTRDLVYIFLNDTHFPYCIQYLRPSKAGGGRQNVSGSQDSATATLGPQDSK